MFSDSDPDCDDLSDGEINKLLIVTQTPQRPKKHDGFDRTGDFCSRYSMTDPTCVFGFMEPRLLLCSSGPR